MDRYDLHKWEESKRKTYTRLLIAQSSIQDFVGIIEYLYQHKRSHTRFIKDSLILRTHVEGLLRRPRTREYSMTLSDVVAFLSHFRIAPVITEEMTTLWANEDNERDKIAMFYKLKGEPHELPLCTKFTFLPPVV